MKSTSTKLTNHLTLVKSNFENKKTNKEIINRIYINTLMPDFTYTNQLGELVTPKKCILL